MQPAAVVLSVVAYPDGIVFLQGLEVCLEPLCQSCLVGFGGGGYRARRGLHVSLEMPGVQGPHRLPPRPYIRKFLLQLGVPALRGQCSCFPHL